MYADNEDNDLIQKADDQAIQKAKELFGDYVISLEGKLDLAIELGKAGDIKMLAVLRDLGDTQDELLTLSQNAHEGMPLRNYHEDIVKIIREYILHIIENEYQKIVVLLQSEGDHTHEATLRVNQLNNIINFYHNEYPELNVKAWSEKVNNLL